MQAISDPKSIQVVAAVSFYWVVSILLVFLNKISMSGGLKLDAPLFLTWTQIVIAVLACISISAFKFQFLKSPPKWLDFYPQFEYDSNTAFRIAPLTFVFIGMIVFNNLCLKYVEVSFYQIARSLTIVFNVILSRFVLHEQVPTKSLLAVGIVVFGYLAGCDGEARVSWIGVIFGLTSSLFVALYAIMVKKALKHVNNDSWRLMFYSNMNSMLLMPIIWALNGEVFKIAESLSAFSTPLFWIVVLSAGLFGFLINIASFLQIEFTSALTHNISGTAKSGFQTLLAFVVYRNPVTIASVMGNVLVLGGSLYYAIVRLQDKKIKDAKKVQEESDILEAETLKATEENNSFVIAMEETGKPVEIEEL